MAIEDANFCFAVNGVGACGRQSDSSVFNKSNMGNAFFSGRLGIPNPREIPHPTIKIPPFFSSAMKFFPLKPNLMKPYRRKDLDYSERIFNYRITRARRTVECSFGMLTKKFGVLQTAMETRVEIAE
jgi:hypothetical protein